MLVVAPRPRCSAHHSFVEFRLRQALRVVFHDIHRVSRSQKTRKALKTRKSGTFRKNQLQAEEVLDSLQCIVINFVNIVNKIVSKHIVFFSISSISASAVLIQHISSISASAASAHQQHQQHQRISSISASVASAHQQY